MGKPFCEPGLPSSSDTDAHEDSLEAFVFWRSDPTVALFRVCKPTLRSETYTLDCIFGTRSDTSLSVTSISLSFFLRSVLRSFSS